MSEQKQTFWRKDNPIVWGQALTLVLFLMVVLLAVTDGPNHVPRFQEFAGLPTNAVGDTLAGIFAPLAFIWIVVTVFIQSQELAEQRKELELTRTEVRLAREAQEKQLAVMELQARIFEDEQKQRNEIRSEKTLTALLDYLADLIDDESTKASLFGPGFVGVTRLHIFRPRKKDENSTDFILRNNTAFRDFWEKSDGTFSEQKGRFRGYIDFYTRILDTCKNILELQQFLHTDQIIRLSKLLLVQFCRDLESFIGSDLWHSDAHIPKEQRG